MRIVIANVYPDDNRGSAALTEASAGLVRAAFPDASLSLVSIRALATDRDEAYRHSLSLEAGLEILPPLVPAAGPAETLLQAALVGARRWRSLPHLHPATLERIEGASLVVSRGGAILRQRGSASSAKALALRLLPLRLALDRRIPVVLLGSHIDAFTTSRLERGVVSRIVRDASLLIPRDDHSAKHALSLGARPDRVVAMPDTVLHLTPAETERAVHVAERHGLQPGRFVIVSLSGRPRHGPMANRGSEALAQACRELLRSGVIDRVVLPAQVSGRLADDTPHLASFARLLPDGTTILVDEDMPPRELASFYGLSAGVIASRMHATILGLIGGVPGMPLVLTDSHRMPEVFRRIGAEEFVVHEEATDPVALARRLETVLTDDTTRSRVGMLVDAARAELSRVPGLLNRLVGHAPT